MKKTLLAAGVTLAMGLISSTAFAGLICNAQGPGANSVDSNPATVVTLGANCVASGSIEDLNLSVHITGGHMEDYDLFLVHVATGTTVKVKDGGPPVDPPHISNPLNVTFDDEAATAYAVLHAGPNGVGTFQPFASLSAFDGESFNGLWQLVIHDTAVPGEGNTLVSWSISAQVPEPGSLALLALGLGAFGLRRRYA